MTQPDPDTLLDDVDFDFSSIEEVEEISENDKLKIPCLKPKQQLIRFLTSAKMEEQYEFIYPGTKREAVKYIHTMRVELSRFREKVRRLGKKNILFKVRIISILPSVTVKGMPPKCAHAITLLRTQKTLTADDVLDLAVVDVLTNHDETK